MFEDLVNVQKLQGMLNNARTDIPKQNDNKKNKVSGIYFIYNKANEIIYVGKAKDIAIRICHHRNGRTSLKHLVSEIGKVTFIEVESASFRTCLEGLYIQYLQPKENGEIKKVGNKRKVVDVKTVAKIKEMLVNGEGVLNIVEKLNVTYNIVIQISTGTTWKGVYVEGFEEWQALPRQEKSILARDNAFSYEEIKEIFKLRYVDKETYKSIAEKFNSSASHIGNILSGRKYAHLYNEMCEPYKVEMNAA